MSFMGDASMKGEIGVADPPLSREPPGHHVYIEAAAWALHLICNNSDSLGSGSGGGGGGGCAAEPRDRSLHPTFRQTNDRGRRKKRVAFLIYVTHYKSSELLLL